MHYYSRLISILHDIEVVKYQANLVCTSLRVVKQRKKLSLSIISDKISLSKISSRYEGPFFYPIVDQNTLRTCKANLRNFLNTRLVFFSVFFSE